MENVLPGTSEAQEEKNVYEWFWWSVLIKGLISLNEVISGTLLFFVPVSVIPGIALSLIHAGWLGSPDGFIAHELLKTLAGYTQGTQIFVAFYLFSRGVIKVGLIIALLMNKLWAYPTSLVIMSLFVLYQLYQILTTHSVLVAAITVFDLVVIYFIWREYQVVRKHGRPSMKSA